MRRNVPSGKRHYTKPCAVESILSQAQGRGEEPHSLNIGHVRAGAASRQAELYFVPSPISPTDMVVQSRKSAWPRAQLLGRKAVLFLFRLTVGQSTVLDVYTLYPLPPCLLG